MPSEYSVPILMYHAVAEDGAPETAPFRVSPAAFRQQMRLLRERGYDAISLEEWAACVAAGRAPLGRRVAITFDDGYCSVARNAWPVLAEAGLSATVFVVTGRVGGVADWDRVSGDPAALMGWEELRDLQQHGNTIASHCALHRDLTELADEAIAADGLEARAVLRRELGREVAAIAYPWGKTDARVRRVLGECGYHIGVGVTGGFSTLRDDLMLLPRIEIFGGDDLDAFAVKIDADNFAAEAAADRGRSSAYTPATVSPAAEQHVLGATDPLAIPERLGRLIDELTAIKAAMDRMHTARTELLPRPGSLQQKFAEVVTAPMSRALEPYQEVSPGIRIGFEPGAHVHLALEPKRDDSASPAGSRDVLRLSFSGGGWLSLAVSLAASEIAGARRYRIGLSARPNRPVACRLLLRQRQGDANHDLELGRIDMDPSERGYGLSGEFALPQTAASSDKVLVAIWEPGPNPLELELDFVDFDFA